MKKLLVIPVIIMIVLFTGACKSKPAPAPREPAGPAQQAPESVPVTVITTPATTTPDVIAPATTTPETTTGTVYGAGTGTTTEITPATTTTVGNRHSSGIILDGAANYTVARGDTLSSIARRFYRDGSLYPLIMMVSANVNDPDRIMPQLQLIIPALEVNMNDPTARASLNSYLLQIAQQIEDPRGRYQTATMMRNHTR